MNIMKVLLYSDLWNFEFYRYLYEFMWVIIEDGYIIFFERILRCVLFIEDLMNCGVICIGICLFIYWFNCFILSGYIMFKFLRVFD